MTLTARMKCYTSTILLLLLLVLAGCNTEDPPAQVMMPTNGSTAQTESTAEATTQGTEATRPTDVQVPPATTPPPATENQTEETKPIQPPAATVPETKPTEPSGTTPPETKPAETAPPETKPAETVPPTTQPPATTEPSAPPATEPAPTVSPSTEPEETTPPPTTEETGPANTKPTAEFKREVAYYAAYYINQYRAAAGVPDCTILPGMTNVAEYRASQLTYNYSHDTEDKREALAYYEYGRWVDATIVGLDPSASYYEADTSEAICAGFEGKTAEEMGKYIADLCRNSSSHWSYIGSGKNLYIGVGVEYRAGSTYGWYGCIMVGRTNYG